MKDWKMSSLTGFAFVAALACSTIPVRGLFAAQQTPGYAGPSTGPQQHPMLSDQPSEDDEARARMEQQREKLAVDDRQKRLREDAARLVELSTELKTEVDSSSKFVTSVTAIRKAEEIEKLAHSVRDRMKN